MSEILLSGKSITHRFGGLVAVRDLSFEVRAGQIFSIIGPNGAGKTTVFNILTGVYAPSEGEILFQGLEIGGLAPEKIAALGIGRTFQNIRLFGEMTVLENCLVGMHTRTVCGILPHVFYVARARREEREMTARAREILGFVGLGDQAGEIASYLAYGDQRRLEIARALAIEPRLILLDEPAAGLNDTEKVELNDLIRKIRAQGPTVVLIEHDMRLVMNISDHILVLDSGEKIAEGIPAEVRENLRVIEAYLGAGAGAGR